MKGFKDFVTRGNVVDLAVAVIVGAAFGALVTALVTDVITPLIAAIGGKPDFSSIRFHVGHGTVLIGSFLNALIAFTLLMLSVYFMVVKPLNAFMARRKRGVAATERSCPECLTMVPVGARKCSACTSPLTPTV